MTQPILSGGLSSGITGSANLMNLLTEKLKYLQASSMALTQNIATADISGVTRKELKPFLKTLHKTKDGMQTDLKGATIDTGEMISRESESLNLGQVAMEYQSLLHMYKRFHDLVRLMIGKG
jgi:flagellar basal body rod protein FlgB